MNIDFLRQKMAEKKLTGYKLGKLTGVSQATISQILTKKRLKPRVDTVSKIAEALECSIEDLI